ncbi:MAG: MMPL family transporter, partial [Chloroflexi bacterium]|nr:MMPL family transporter [Chloroflexota bacterium]
MLYRLGELMVRFRWAVVVVWAVAFLVAGLLAPRVFSALSPGFGRADTESQQAIDLLAQKLGLDENVLIVVISHPELKVTDPAFRQGVEQVLAGLDGLTELTGVATLYSGGTPSFASRDGHTTYALVSLKGTFDEGMALYPEVRERLKAPTGFQMWSTGGIAIFSELNEAAENDLRRSEAVSFPLVLVALAVVFGALLATFMPIVMATVAVIMTMAAVYLLTQLMDVSIFVLNIASFLGIGLAIDYTLLVVSRFREELQQRDVAPAVAVTLATSGRAILFSGLTTVMGLSGLFFIPFMFFRSLGIGGVVVVLASMLVVLTLVPALLGILGAGVNRFRILPERRSANGGFWRGVASRVMRHPVLVSVPVALALLLLGAPFLGVKLGQPWATVLPVGAEPRVGWEKVERDFGEGELTPIAVVVQASGGVLRPEVVGDLYDFAHRFAGDPRVERVESIVTLDPSIPREGYQQMYASPQAILAPAITQALASFGSQDVTVVRIFSRYAVLSPETEALVVEARSQGRTLAPGATALVTGATADLEDTKEVMYQYFPWVIAYVVVATYLVLLVLFRSVVLPLKAVIMNALSILASYGAMVFIFQDGNFQNLLGFQAGGYVEVTVPILLFCILFGLSMDYEVFLL